MEGSDLSKYTLPAGITTFARLVLETGEPIGRVAGEISAPPDLDYPPSGWWDFHRRCTRSDV